jgi:hypothetical protein
VQRRYWQCRCGQPGAYAIDPVLNLEHRLTRRLQEKACHCGAEVSFRRAENLLEKLLDLTVSAESLRQLCEQHGGRMQEWQPKDTTGAKEFRQATGEVEMSIDAGKVNTLEEQWKDLKIVVFQKREPGASMEPSRWPEQRLPDATCRVAFADIQPAKDFRKVWPKWLKRLGIHSSDLHVLGDGAGWIWRSVQRRLPECQQTLDFFHACEHLAKAAASWHGEGTEASHLAYERGRTLLVESGWTGVCAWVNEELGTDFVADRLVVRDKLLNYFGKHATRLDYAGNLAAGQAIGSGAVEGQAKTLGLRLKARGARWRKTNARRMAAFVSVFHSHQWDSYWTTAV